MTRAEKAELAVKHWRRGCALAAEAASEAPTENLRWNIGGTVVRVERERRRLEKYAHELRARDE